MSFVWHDIITIILLNIVYSNEDTNILIELFNDR